MVRSASDTRRRILDAAYELFYRKGFQSAGVDEVAARAGITKRTLYNHFPSKDDLIGAVLSAQGSKTLAQLQMWKQDPPQDPADLIRRMFDYLRNSAADPEWRGSGFTRAAMEVAWAPGHPARSEASIHKRSVEDLIAELLGHCGFPEPASAARQIVTIFEGALVLRLIHGDDDYIDASEMAALAVCGSSG